MATTHEVTVHIWKNSKHFGKIQNNQADKTRYDDLVTGHASLKLQRVDAQKWDHFYLSFSPPVQKGQEHAMGVSYGSTTKNEKQKQWMTEDPEDPLENVLSTNIWRDDKAYEKKRADLTYRFTGPAYEPMKDFIIKLASANKKWRLKYYNCSEAVADCLSIGGAKKNLAIKPGSSRQTS
jgi:hypothetical protein